MKKYNLIQKEYTYKDLKNIIQDVYDAFNPYMNEIISDILDSDYLNRGKFRLTIEFEKYDGIKNEK